MVDDAEAILRRKVRTVRGLRAFHYRTLTGAETFWPDSAAMTTVEAQDEQGECQRVACRVAERHGLSIAVGWCLDLDGRACWHCANVYPANGELVDAGRGRHLPGLLGKVLSEREAAALTRAAGQVSGAELLQRGSGLVGALLG
jgi:hypothetical protein